MSTDIRSFLKESGYLDSPTQRLFWRGVTPTFRGHLRLLGMVTLTAGGPLALLLSSLTRLTGSDRLVLFLFYLGTMALALAALDLILALLLRLPNVVEWLLRGPWINRMTVVTSGLLFLPGLYFLDDLIAERPVSMQVLLWLTWMVTAFLMGSPPRLMILSRLYWHGLRLPRRRASGLLTLVALLALGVVRLLGPGQVGSTPVLTAHKAGKLVLLAFDIPATDAASYEGLWPQWPVTEFRGEEGSITDFWAGLGTGTANKVHRSSLYHFRSSLFMGQLSASDPTQILPFLLLKTLGLTQPEIGGGRFRKYFWEILDSYGLKTYALNYWHTFPATSENGGVLSERWHPGLTAPPYMSGLQLDQPVERLHIKGSGTFRGLIERENQAWFQLCQQIAAQNFDLTVAYFPLSDNLSHLNPETRMLFQTEIVRFRSQMLADFLARIGDDVAVGIIIASGKTTNAGQIPSARLFSNSTWRQRLTTTMTDQRQLAPTILNFYGLPADYLMYATAYPNAPLSQGLIDYGEPSRKLTPNLQQDTRYYQELKALGYIQ